MPDNPNPQGKGLVPVLATLSETRAMARAVPPKHIEQITNELFTSLFVLESEFKFRPVAERSYWLYRKSGRFWLSPVGPHEWGPESYGRYIGECELQRDMTWTLALSEEAAGDGALLAFIEQKRNEFENQVRDADAVDDILPGYRSEFSFYRRAHAFALAHSLGASMDKSGIRGLTHEQAWGALEDARAREEDLL